MKSLLSITDLSKDEIVKIIKISLNLQKNPYETLRSKNILFAFEKPSLRTKIGTEVAINQLGGNVVHISPDNFFAGNILWAKNKTKQTKGRESLKDTVKNVSEWCDAIFARVFDHQVLVEMQQYSTIPVVNALCDQHHPMQALADLLTIQENFEDQKVSVAFVGDGNNVAFSLFEILLKFGYPCYFAGPEKYDFTLEKKTYLNKLALEHETQIIFSNNPISVVKNANIIYTDTFVSMGEESILEEKMKHFVDYQVNQKLFSYADENALFMHCLPAHRGVEVTDEIIDSKKSVVYQQAKNRMVISKGVFTYLLNPNYDKK